MFTTPYVLLADITEASWQLKKRLPFNRCSSGYSQRAYGTPATFLYKQEQT